MSSINRLVGYNGQTCYTQTTNYKQQTTIDKQQQMEFQSCKQFEETYSQLMKGNFNQSVSLFTKLMSDNTLEILDLAEAETETDSFIGSTLSQSNTSLCSGGSNVSVYSSSSSSNNSDTSSSSSQLSSCCLSERGHIRTHRLKRAFKSALKGREEPLSRQHSRHLKKALLLAVRKLEAFPDQSAGYLEAAAVMSLLSQWDAAEEIYEIGLLRCEASTNQLLLIEQQLEQLRAINRHICDTLARTQPHTATL